MKRNFTLTLFLWLLFFPFCIKSFAQNSEKSKLAIFVNPMGFLFFGPAVNVGWALDDKTTINLDVRRNSWGLLARKIRASDPELFSIDGMGYALGFNRYLNNIKDGMYYGAFLSFDVQNTKYIENSPWQWHEKTKTIGLIVNAGKRFKLGSKYFVNAGAVVGGGIVNFEWEYDDVTIGVNDFEERKGKSFVPIGSLELSFGMFIL